MNLDLTSLNWLAIGLCLIVAQVFLSVWFIVIFGNPWAKEYGVQDKKQHTKEIPPYTYGIQAFCSFLLILGLSMMQSMLSIDSAIGGLSLGLFVAIFYSLSTALPGYIFLKRHAAFLMAMGSQFILILLVSVILSVWP